MRRASSISADIRRAEVASGSAHEQSTIRAAWENTMSSELAAGSFVNAVALRFGWETAPQFRQAISKL